MCCEQKSYRLKWLIETLPSQVNLKIENSFRSLRPILTTRERPFSMSISKGTENTRVYVFKIFELRELWKTITLLENGKPTLEIRIMPSSTISECEGAFFLLILTHDKCQLSSFTL